VKLDIVVILLFYRSGQIRFLRCRLLLLFVGRFGIAVVEIRPFQRLILVLRDLELDRVDHQFLSACLNDTL